MSKAFTGVDSAVCVLFSLSPIIFKLPQSRPSLEHTSFLNSSYPPKLQAAAFRDSLPNSCFRTSNTLPNKKEAAATRDNLSQIIIQNYQLYLYATLPFAGQSITLLTL